MDQSKSAPLFLLGVGSMIYIVLLSLVRSTINTASYLGLILPFLLAVVFILYNNTSRLVFRIFFASILFSDVVLTVVILLYGETN
jgi:hypothetical protein